MTDSRNESYTDDDEVFNRTDYVEFSLASDVCKNLNDFNTNIQMRPTSLTIQTDDNNFVMNNCQNVSTSNTNGLKSV